MLEVRLIGRFDIQFDGKPVILSSRAAQSLFAYLILTSGTLHRREKLAGMLWPDESEKTARTYLRNELWRIRKALPQTSNIEYFLADNLTIGFNQPSAYWLDVAGLKKLGDTASVEELVHALSNYQGELLPGFYEDWAILEREHLQVLFEQKIARLLEMLEKEQRWDDILEWAERWISLARAPEAAYRALMRAYDTLGNHAKVVSTYERCTQALGQLELEPSEQTRALAFKRNPRINIPIPLTSFIGRERELKEVARLFAKSRLITLTGSGGVGKTRLAIQVVAEVLDLFPDGVWFLDLAPLSDSSLVSNVLASLLGLRESGEIPITDVLKNYFRSRTALVIFDNCEHLIVSCAQLINSLLTSCENLAVLATSREILRVSGEFPYRVPSLEIPRSDVEFNVLEISSMEAIKLFVERVAITAPNLVISQQNVMVIAQICQRLDGIPLAIELAAALVNVLSAEQILSHLDDRFKLLTNGLRSALPRHQTLRATIEWSYDLLSEKECVVFRRLAVFLGGWTLEAAEAVCAGGEIVSDEVLELLSQLVNKSLVIAEEARDKTGDLTRRSLRYQMLETLRQYAKEKLVEPGESDVLRDKHLKYFLNLVETAEPHLIRPEQLEWLPLLDADYENVRLAFEWAMKQASIESSLNLCTALGWFWDIRGYWSEGFNWLTRALANQTHDASHSEKVARARALYTYAHCVAEIGNFEHMLSPAEDSLALALELGDQKDIAIARFSVGFALRLRGEVDAQALSLMQQSFTEFQALNDLFWQARSFPRLGFTLARQGKLKFGDVSLISLELARKAGERVTLANALSDYADWLLRNSQFEEAIKHAEESDRLSKQIGSDSNSVNVLNFADIAWINDDYPKARLLNLELLERCNLFGMRSITPICLANLGLLAMEEGDLNQAQQYLEQALAVAREVGWKLSIAYRLTELSNLFYLQGNLEAFKQNFRESLSLKNYLSEYQRADILMTILGSLYIQEPDGSARLLGVLDQYFERNDNHQHTPIEKRYCVRAETHTSMTLGDVAFQSAFAEGQKLSVDEGLDLALKTVEKM